MRMSGKLTLGVAVGAVGAATASAAPFTPGNIVVGRVTLQATAGQAAPVELLEYTPSGTLVQSIPLPSSGASALTVRDTATTEGILSRSPDGRFLSFAGYRADAGSANPAAATATAVPRVVGVIGAAGVPQISTGFTDAYGGDSFRSAVTDNGTRFWLSGAASSATAGGLRFLGSINDASTTALTTAGGNSRQVQIQAGNLYVSAGSNVPGRSVFQVGSGGLPTTGPQTLNPLFPPVTGPQYNSYYFADLSGPISYNGTGFDTLYAADTNSGLLEKFTFDGTSWTTNGTQAQAGLANLVGTTSGSLVTLTATTNLSNTGSIFTFTDTSGYGSPLAGSFVNLLGTGNVGTGFAFRGVQFAPVPEPTGLALLGIAGVAGLLRRRRPGRPSRA